MDSYQIIVDIVGIENDLEEPYSILFNVFECYKLDFIKRLTVENLEEFNKFLNKFEKLSITDLITEYKRKLKDMLTINENIDKKSNEIKK